MGVLFQSILMLGSDVSEGMTAPLPPILGPAALFDAQLAQDFLQQKIVVKTSLLRKVAMTIAEDWKRTIQNEKDKDQEKNNTIDTKQNAKKWIAAAYDIMIPYLKKHSDAQKQFASVYLPYLQTHQTIKTGISKLTFANKQYENFLQSDVLKNVMFVLGMKVLGHSTVTIAGNEHPVGGHNKKKNTIPEKSAKERIEIKKKYAEINALEKKMLDQEKQVDAFNVLVDEGSGRLALEDEYQKETQTIMNQMTEEKARLDALRVEVAKEIVEPERHKKRSNWSIMTNEKAVQVLTEPSLDQNSSVVIQAARNLLDIDESSSRSEIEQAFAEGMSEIAQIQNLEQQKTYTQALKVAEEVLDRQVAKSDHENQPISDEFRKFIQEHAIKIARRLITEGNTVNEIMKDPNLIHLDLSSQQIAYMMGYVQSCMNMLQQGAMKNSVDSIVRMVEVLKNINLALQQARG